LGSKSVPSVSNDPQSLPFFSSFPPNSANQRPSRQSTTGPTTTTNTHTQTVEKKKSQNKSSFSYSLSHTNQPAQDDKPFGFMVGSLSLFFLFYLLTGFHFFSLI
jgi:hypothetical protein